MKYAEAVAFLESLLPDLFIEGGPGLLFDWGYSVGFKSAIECLRDPDAVPERINAHKAVKAVTP